MIFFYLGYYCWLLSFWYNPLMCFREWPGRGAYPANTRRSPTVGTMSGQRRRRWANIVPTFGEDIFLLGISSCWRDPLITIY